MDKLTEYAERMWLGEARMRGLFADGAPMGVAAGGAAALADRARAAAAADDLRLAGDLVELAALAAPDDPAVHQTRAEINEARVAAEPSQMAQGVFRWAARESRRAARAGRSEHL